MIELYSKQASSSGKVTPPPWGDTGSITLSDGQKYGYVFPTIVDQATFNQYMTTNAYYYGTDYPYKAFNRRATGGSVTSREFWYMYSGKSLYTFDFKESVYINALRNYGYSTGGNYLSYQNISYHFEDGTTYTHTPYFSSAWKEHIFTDPRFYTQKVTKFTIQWSSGGSLPVIDELQFLYLKESV